MVVYTKFTTVCQLESLFRTGRIKTVIISVIYFYAVLTMILYSNGYETCFIHLMQKSCKIQVIVLFTARNAQTARVLYEFIRDQMSNMQRYAVDRSRNR